MAADAGSLRLYVDESALGLGKALAAARKDTIHVGHPLIPECPLGALDTDWIPAVAARGLIAIGRDKRIRTKHEEIRQLTLANLRVFRVGGKRDASSWDWLVRVVRYWEAIEEVIRNRPDGPWFYLINEGGLAELPLDR
ncbi:MAG: hypothetical protein JO147_02335 [Actinobacteria bacterium]|nr:hypothetical protein [Actinomycetota bacterium]